MRLHSSVSTARFNKMVSSRRLGGAGITRLHRTVVSAKPRHNVADGDARSASELKAVVRACGL